MTVVQGMLLGSRPGVHLPRHRHVQARVVLWASPGRSSPSSSPSGSPGASSARTWPPSSRAECTSRIGIERPIYRLLRPTRSGADLAALRRLAHRLLGRVDRLHLRDLRHPGITAAQPPAPRRRPPGARLQHRRVFVTNTNWQNYGGETTMSYLSQMVALTVQQFVAAAVGIALPSPWSGASPAGARRRSGTSGSTSSAASSTSSCRSPSSPGSSSSARGRSRPWPARPPSTTP